MTKSSILIPHDASTSLERRLWSRLRSEIRYHGEDIHPIRRRAAGAAAVGATCHLQWKRGIINRDNMTATGRRSFDSGYTHLQQYMQSPDLQALEARTLPGLEYPEAYGLFVHHLAGTLLTREVSYIQRVELARIQCAAGQIPILPE